MNKLLLTVFLSGVRDDSYKDKDNNLRERYLADVYLPGTGAFSIPLTRQVYDVLVSVPPMSGQYELPVSIEVVNRVVKSAGAGGRITEYARQELALRFGDLSPVAAKKSA